MKKRFAFAIVIAILLVATFTAEALALETFEDRDMIPPPSPGLDLDQPRGEIKVNGIAVYPNRRIKTGEILDFSELGGGIVIYKAPEFSGLADAAEATIDSKVTVTAPASFNVNVNEWVVTQVNTSVRMVELVPEDYDYNISVSGKKVCQWTMITAYDTISFGNNNGTLIYFEDTESTIPLFKAEGAKSYILGFGNSEENKILAWTVRKCDPFHNLIELCPSGLGGASYKLLDSGRVPLYIDHLYNGMCIEVNAEIRISTDIFDDLDIKYYLPGNGQITKSIKGDVINIPSPGAEYDPIRFWIITNVNSTTNSLELQPLYDTKPSFDYYYPTDEGTKSNPWHVGKYDDITAYIESGVLYLNGTGAMVDYLYDYAPWYDATHIISEVCVGEGITSVGADAFQSLKSLSKVSLPASLTSINRSAFAFCYSLPYIEIPSNVQTIGASAFKECSNLKKMKIGSGLKTVESSAFSYVQLDQIEYEGTEADWDAISINRTGGYNDGFANATKIFLGKSPNATASIFAEINNINTVIILISAAVVCTCAIICTAFYIRKKDDKKR